MTERIYIFTGNFQRADDISFHWSDYSCMFDCPCGIKEIILSESGESKRCDCGRVYKLVAYVGMVQEQS